MSLLTQARKLHKWFALVIGVQLLIWAVSGFYMVVVNLDFIHGDHLVKNTDQAIAPLAQTLIPAKQLLYRYSDIESITLTSVTGHPYYIVQRTGTNLLIDAASGQQLSPIDEAMALAIAQYHYKGETSAAQAILITENPPQELYSRPLPLWRVNFSDRINTSFYIDPNTAQFITRRHDFWRIFDFFWMLHIMDYDDRTDINNMPLRVATLLSLITVVAGFVLLFYKNPLRRHQPNDSLKDFS